MIGLIDCNNFFVSCERVFNPKLHNRPVIVLSNNDGCAIARSDEVKALGISMGQPYYQIKPLIKKHNIAVLSSNFALYGNMSQRIMDIVHESVPLAEVYSIDEAFIDFSGVEHCESLAKHLRAKIIQYTGVPVSIGVARTKVLAKMANRVAKCQYQAHQKGVFVLTQEKEASILKQIAVNEIWGIGRNLSKKLHAININTANQLRIADESLIRDKFGIVMARLQQELKGQSVLCVNDFVDSKKQILVSRSFGKTVNDYGSLCQAITKFIYSGAKKLRQQNSSAAMISLALSTNKFGDSLKQYHPRAQIKLLAPTSSSKELCYYAKALLKDIFVEGYDYKRAGIALMDISNNQHTQGSLLNNQNEISIDGWCNDRRTLSSDKVDNVMDDINKKYGLNTLKPATLCTKKQAWHMNQNLKSPNYIGRWDELMVVR